MFFSQLYLEARALSEGSMIPPRRRRTRWRVDSYIIGKSYSQPTVPSQSSFIHNPPCNTPLLLLRKG
ncbi:hypothetical protein BDW72DRAFT_171798 [Aspergillus terricola var. indicus]